MNKSLLKNRRYNWVVTGISFTVGISGLFSTDGDTSRAEHANAQLSTALNPAQTPAERRKEYFKRAPSISNFKTVQDELPTLSLEDYAVKEKEVSSLEYSFVQDGCYEALCSLIKLGEIFGFKKYIGAPQTISHENASIISVDISFPNLRRVALSRLAGVSPEPIKLDRGNGFLSRFSFTLGNLQWLLGESSPLKEAYERIEQPKGPERDEINSGLAPEIIDWLTDLIVRPHDGAIIDMSNIYHQYASDFRSSIKRLLANKTGFQRIMSLVTATVLNSSQKENVHFVKGFTGISLGDENTNITYEDPRIFSRHPFYDAPIDFDRLNARAFFMESIRMAAFDFERLTNPSDLDWTVLHELTHAYHYSIDFCPLPDSDELCKLGTFVNYSIMNSPQIDFRSLFYPMLRPALSKDPMWDIASSYEKQNYITSWKSGFGYSVKRFSSFREGESLSMHDINDMWKNPLEMLAMQGILPLLIDNQVYVIEDRHSENMFVNRAGSFEESFRFHDNSIHLEKWRTKVDSTYGREKYKDQGDYVLDYRSRHDETFSVRQIQILRENLRGHLRRITNSARFNSDPYDTVLTIPADVTSLADAKFHLYPYLERVNFAPGCQLKKIDTCSFSVCKSLREVILPEGIEEIGCSAFYGCKSLSKIKIPESVTKIGDSAFYECEHLGDVDGVLIPGRVVRIDYSAFFGSFVGNIKIPNADIITIGRSAFSNSKLRKIEAPEGSIKKIGDRAFYGCNELNRLILDKGVSKIGKYAFACCSELAEVEIPRGVNTIEKGAFSECNKLSKIILPYGVTKLGGKAFANCKELIEVTIPGSVRTIEDGAFYGCSKLSNLVLGNGIQVIGKNAFADCKELMEVEIPKTIKEISYCAFYGCDKLSGLFLCGDISNIGAYAFAYCRGLTRVRIPGSVKQIGDSAFVGCYNLMRLDLGDGIYRIGENAFSYCYGLTRVEIPGSVREFGDCAFYNCNNLTHLVLRDGIEIIEDLNFTFADCFSLEEVEIPETITEIDPSAFHVQSKRKQKLKIKTSSRVAAKISQETLDRWYAEIAR
ncbi:MAG: leucine-rich repeat domain-containing protein [Holosporales bacterium]|jgi:hypothetical protein|nr:leucine-rich repeat domain-containing protein [Holosporales bacterium]